MYVQRDVRTLARWEKDRGLPVRRVPGSRGQVFAFTSEIDEWLTSTDSQTDRPSSGAAGSDTAEGGGTVLGTRPAVPASRQPPVQVGRVAAALSVVALAILTVATPSLRQRPPISEVQIEHDELVARTTRGEAWRYSFGAPVSLSAPERAVIADVDEDGKTEVVTVVHRPGPGVEPDELHTFSRAGALLWRRTLADSFVFGRERFGPPWRTGPLHVFGTAAGQRILWITHHQTWWPSLVALFDGNGTLVGRFVHAGWITRGVGLPDGRVVLGGVSNRYQADIVAILDQRSWDGAGPPLEGIYACSDCPEGRPAKYVVLPRSELSLATGSKRLPPIIDVFDDRIEVRIVQSDSVTADIIYEFSRVFDLRRIRPSDAYWEWHRELEVRQVIRHGVADCPEHQEAVARVWEPDRGWFDMPVAAHTVTADGGQ